MTSSVGHVPINKILFFIKRMTFVELALNDRFYLQPEKQKESHIPHSFPCLSVLVFNIVKCSIWVQKSLLKKYKFLY